jgi:hypothetical protein
MIQWLASPLLPFCVNAPESRSSPSGCPGGCLEAAGTGCCAMCQFQGLNFEPIACGTEQSFEHRVFCLFCKAGDVWARKGPGCLGCLPDTGPSQGRSKTAGQGSLTQGSWHPPPDTLVPLNCSAPDVHTYIAVPGGGDGDRREAICTWGVGSRFPHAGTANRVGEPLDRSCARPARDAVDGSPPDAGKRRPGLGTWGGARAQVPR